MSDQIRFCVQCHAVDDRIVYRRRRDGAWFDDYARVWRDHHGSATAVNPRRVADDPEWLESIGRARQQRTRVQLDGVCGACAQQRARMSKLDGAA